MHAVATSMVRQEASLARDQLMEIAVASIPIGNVYLMSAL